MQNEVAHFEIVKDIVNESVKLFIQFFPIFLLPLHSVLSKTDLKSVVFENIELKYCLSLIVCPMRFDEIKHKTMCWCHKKISTDFRFSFAAVFSSV